MNRSGSAGRAERKKPSEALPVAKPGLEQPPLDRIDVPVMAEPLQD